MGLGDELLKKPVEPVGVEGGKELVEGELVVSGVWVV